MLLLHHISFLDEDGYVTNEEAEIAKQKPLVTTERKTGFLKDAEYYSEEVRRAISYNLGDDALYEGGLIVRTTIDPKIQSVATKAFRKGLIEYDIRHGYTGTKKNIKIDDDYKDNLKKAELPKGAEISWEKAVVLESSKKQAKIETINDNTGYIYLEDITWAKPRLKNNAVGAEPSDVSKVLNVGDVIYVEKLITSKSKKDDAYEDLEGLQQMRTLARNMIFLMKSIELGKKEFGVPEREKGIATNFIR